MDKEKVICTQNEYYLLQKNEILQILTYINMDVCEYYHVEMSQTQTPRFY